MEETTSQRTITEKWLDNLFDSLMRLEVYERLAKDGCSNLLEYLSINDKEISQIQYKNYSLFLTEAEVVINSCRNLIKEENCKKILFEIEMLKLYEQKIDSFLEKKINQKDNISWFELRPEFVIAVKRLSKIRKMLVENLWEFLSPIPVQNQEISSI